MLSITRFYDCRVLAWGIAGDLGRDRSPLRCGAYFSVTLLLQATGTPKTGLVQSAASVMEKSEQDSEINDVPRDRLNGWKEISHHLGKSVRTVQRWERDLGLPIHRLRTNRGEIIWALRQEIDRWLSTKDNGTHVGTAVHSRRELVLAATILFAVAGSLFVVLNIDWRVADTPSVVRPDQPSSFRIIDRQIQVYDRSKRMMWEHAFPFVLSEVAYQDTPAYAGSNNVQFYDLNGDGTSEVIFVAKPRTTPDDELFVFDSAGRVLFQRRPGRYVRFGSKENSPPFYITNLLLTTDSRGEKHLWLVSQHNTSFPSVVEKLSPDGKVRGEYWSSGHITELAVAFQNARRVILVAAMYNHERRTSLSVLDYDNPTGVTPSIDPLYRCPDCPPEAPLLFYVFPQPELARVLENRPRIDTLRVTPHGETVLAVESAGMYLSGDVFPSAGSVFYFFNSRFELKNVEASDSYRLLHRKLELSGSLKHPYDARHDTPLSSVLLWDGKKFSFVTPLKTAAASSVN